MRVSGSSAGNRIASAKKGKRSSGKSSGFSLAKLSRSDTPQPSAEVSGTGSINNIDALLALQAAPDPLEKRKKALRRADDMLDILEDLRIGLLNGQISETRLKQLAHLASKHHGLATNTRLADVLDSIELRAQVELAKLGR